MAVGIKASAELDNIFKSTCEKRSCRGQGRGEGRERGHALDNAAGVSLQTLRKTMV